MSLWSMVVIFISNFLHYILALFGNKRVIDLVCILPILSFVSHFIIVVQSKHAGYRYIKGQQRIQRYPTAASDTTKDPILGKQWS